MAVSSAQNTLGGCIHAQGVAHTMKHSREERGLLSSMPGRTLAHQHREAEQSSPALCMSLLLGLPTAQRECMQVMEDATHMR